MNALIYVVLVYVYGMPSSMLYVGYNVKIRNQRKKHGNVVKQDKYYYSVYKRDAYINTKTCGSRERGDTDK